MTENPQNLLATLILASAVLSGSEGKTAQSPDLATVLKSRLTRAHEILQDDNPVNFSEADLRKLQYITARVSLSLLEKIQNVVDPVNATPSSDPPLLGTRDISHVRTLISIVFKWAADPLLDELELTRPGVQTHGGGQPRIVDLTERQLDHEDLPAIMMSLLGLLFTPGPSSRIRQSWITTSMLNQHAVDILRPCLIIGWAPKHVSETFARHAKDIKALSIRIINVLRPHETITALGTVLSSATSKRTNFPYISRACSFLLSNQLKRPDGVRGLCTAVFGEGTEDTDAAPLDKLEYIAKVLTTVPSTANPKEYYLFIIPRILAILRPSSDESSPSHKRAAAFALSRMLSTKFQHHITASATLLPLLHTPFLIAADNREKADQPAFHLTAVESLQTLQTFILHADPSPTELSALLTPIVSELYTLALLHHSSKTADPNVRESLDAILNTWGRVVGSSDVIGGMWEIISGSGGIWELEMHGFTRSVKPVPSPTISLLTAAEIEASSRDETDINANPFNLRPDPSEFVRFLKALDRKDISSELFVRLLNEYRELKENEGQPMRTLLYLQLILQIQTQLSTTVLSKPEHVLSFIKHALGPQSPPSSSLKANSGLRKGLGLKDLRIIEEDTSSADSDDEPEGAEGLSEAGGGKDEMVVTAITLLLSILEAKEDISPHNTPDLNDILTSLDRLTSHRSPAIRQLSREARLVLTARTASTSSVPPAAASRHPVETEAAQATYQKALKHLQDPIIPVRAHGLQLLRELVSRPSAAGSKPSKARSDGTQLDPALMPGILSIFLQSIQDDESYIFLNAVQGLAAMVDGYGREVLRGVVDVYLSGTGVGGSGVTGAGGTAMSKEELDARIRVGEALNTIVKRCEGALGLYTDILIPPLLTILRSVHLPTTLRTSALAILAQCAATNALALQAYTASLAETCVELIQIESVATRSVHPGSDDTQSTQAAADDEARGSEKHNAKRPPDLMDADPTTKVTKAAPLRRSALHFLSLLLRSHIVNLYDSRPSSKSAPTIAMSVGGTRLAGMSIREEVISDATLKRAGIVLAYVAATDEDAVVKVMARETVELIEQYKEASLGF